MTFKNQPPNFGTSKFGSFWKTEQEGILRNVANGILQNQMEMGSVLSKHKLKDIMLI